MPSIFNKKNKDKIHISPPKFIDATNKQDTIKIDELALGDLINHVLKDKPKELSEAQDFYKQLNLKTNQNLIVLLKLTKLLLREKTAFEIQEKLAETPSLLRALSSFKSNSKSANQKSGFSSLKLKQTAADKKFAENMQQQSKEWQQLLNTLKLLMSTCTNPDELKSVTRFLIDELSADQRNEIKLVFAGDNFVIDTALLNIDNSASEFSLNKGPM